MSAAFKNVIAAEIAVEEARLRSLIPDIVPTE